MKYNHKVELEFNLANQNCDSAANIMGPKPGTSVRAQEACPIGLPNHCACHGSEFTMKGVLKQLK